jgi:hypothetical protein
LDSDGDGLPDYLDSCPHTPSGDVIDRNGCSIDDLCPCDGPWKNHGEYVGRFLAVSGEFVNEGLITEAERRRLLSRAADSDCGKTR